MFDGTRVLTKHSAIHAAQHHSEGETFVIVRVPKEDEIVLSTALDAGASGIIIPHCETKEEVEEFMQKMYYRKYINSPFAKEKKKILEPVELTHECSPCRCSFI